MALKFKLSLMRLISAILVISTSTGLFSATQEEESKRIFSALTGVDLSPSDGRLAMMSQHIANGDPLAAARIASDDKNFYNVTLLNWAAPWSSTSGSVANPFDDLQALAIGLVRDRSDIRMLLTGSTLYKARQGINGLPYSPANNNHFLDLGRSGLSLATVLESFARPDGRQIGVFGTRGFSAAYYDAGTNRRAAKFAIEHFLCRPISGWRELQLPDDFVRRDVSRMPAGSLREYHQECRGCHAPMDGLSGAFAKVDFSGGQFVTLNAVAPKFNLHADVFPDGYEVKDGRWVNYLASHQTREFGWRSPTEGSTLEEFAQMLANSRAFSRCMSERAAVEICDSYPSDTFLDELAVSLEESRYDMRKLFEIASIHPSCRGT